jgi:hypothetical protein
VTVLRAGDFPNQMVTHTLEATQLWRQVGWIGLSTDQPYPLEDEEGVRSDPAGFRPLWVLVEDEPPLPHEEES